MKLSISNRKDKHLFVPCMCEDLSKSYIKKLHYSPQQEFLCVLWMSFSALTSPGVRIIERNFTSGILYFFGIILTVALCMFLLQLGEQPSLEEAIRIASRIQQGETPGLDD